MKTARIQLATMTVEAADEEGVEMSKYLESSLKSSGVKPDVVAALRLAMKNILRSKDHSGYVYASAMDRAMREHLLPGVKMQVMYMLLGARYWRGDEAKAAKKLLNKWAVSPSARD